MKKFYCYEITTDSSYTLWADTSEERRNVNLAMALAETEKQDEALTYCTGECKAESVDQAAQMVSAGEWAYSQYC